MSFLIKQNLSTNDTFWIHEMYMSKLKKLLSRNFKEFDLKQF